MEIVALCWVKHSYAALMGAIFQLYTVYIAILD